MKYGRWGLSLLLVAVAVITAGLTGLTVTHWRQSHAALQRFDAALSGVTQREDPRRIDVTVTLKNNAETPTLLEFMGLDVYCRGRLIVSHNWFPDDFRVPAGETVNRSFELESNLQLEHLQNLPEEGDAWEARMRFRIAHPAQDGTFLVDIRRSPAE